MSVFVIAYVWQNIEVMKIKMDYRKLVNVKKKILKENDRLIFEIEKFRTMEDVSRYAGRMGLYRIGPDDITVIYKQN